jgi:hypothetical protein
VSVGIKGGASLLSVHNNPHNSLCIPSGLLNEINPARKDGAVFHHWRRVADEGKDYPFARFNKAVDTPTYSDLEYQQHLHDDNWTSSLSPFYVILFSFILLSDALPLQSSPVFYQIVL